MKIKIALSVVLICAFICSGCTSLEPKQVESATVESTTKNKVETPELPTPTTMPIQEHEEIQNVEKPVEFNNDKKLPPEESAKEARLELLASYEFQSKNLLFPRYNTFEKMFGSNYVIVLKATGSKHLPDYFKELRVFEEETRLFCDENIYPLANGEMLIVLTFQSMTEVENKDIWRYKMVFQNDDKDEVEVDIVPEKHVTIANKTAISHVLKLDNGSYAVWLPPENDALGTVYTDQSTGTYRFSYRLLMFGPNASIAFDNLKLILEGETSDETYDANLITLKTVSDEPYTSGALYNGILDIEYTITMHFDNLGVSKIYISPEHALYYDVALSRR